MRETKFRGRRIDNGLWIYGDLFRDANTEELLLQHKISDTKYPKWICETIDPETVGQFTGLHNKNGKEIYEGDICNVRRYFHLEPFYKWHTCEVIWGCEYGWGFRGYYNGKGNGDYYGIRFAEANTIDIEVIGNIYEHPELLEAKDGNDKQN